MTIRATSSIIILACSLSAIAQPGFMETFNSSTKATLENEGWGFFPNAGFTVTDQQGYDMDHIRSNAGIGQDEFLLTPCLAYTSPVDTFVFHYRTFSGTVGFVSLGYQSYDDPVGQNVFWVDTLTPVDEWTAIYVPYEPPVWPNICRIVFGFGAVEAGGKVGLENFGSLHAQSAGTCDMLLPMTLMNFSAELSTSDLMHQVNLSWQVAQESGVSEYVITRSTNCREFERISSVEATGNDNYTFIDDNPISGPVCYRIVAIDASGEEQMSDVVTVHVPQLGVIEEKAGIISYSGDHTVRLVIYTTTGSVIWDDDLQPGASIDLTGHSRCLILSSSALAYRRLICLAE